MIRNGFFFTGFFFNIFFTSLVIASSVTLPGNMEEKFDVTQNGNVSYSIHIKVPPGIQHLQPNITLNYNSRAKNGLLGVGWDLIGIPSVERTKRIIAIDGVSGTVAYNYDDKFSYHGQRLINISGAYGKNNAKYHTEIESWNQFTSHGQQGEGPEYFSMKSKKGELFEFGKTANSRVKASESNHSVRTWLLEKVTDLNGNSLRIQYSENPLNNKLQLDNRLYPVEIAYTANENQDYQGNRFVRFVYEKRPDVETSYLGGYAITTSIRLTAIETFIGKVKVNSYRLSYKVSPSTHRSVISNVQLCSGSSNLNCITPIELKYQKGVESFDSLQSWGNEFTKQNGWDGVNQPFTLSDVNGDGFLDIVGFGKQSTQVSLSNGKSFQPLNSWSKAFTANEGWTSGMPRLMADVNGDGMADVIGFGNHGVQVGISTGNSFDIKIWPNLEHFGTQHDWGSSTPRQLADVNNDGLADIVGFGKNELMVSLSTSTGFSEPKKWTSQFTLNNNWTSDMPRLLADVNGDGMADVIGFSNHGVQVGISTGRSFDTNKWNMLDKFGNDQSWTSSTPRMVADVNNDGLTDIIGFGLNNVMVSLSTGKRFASPASWSEQFTSSKGWTNNNPRILGDVNGDGFVDIVGIGNKKVQVGISTGTAFELKNWNENSLSELSLSVAGTQASTTRIVADINGDGLSDIIGFGIKNVLAGLSAGPIPDLATDITRSSGAHYKVSYAPLSDTTVYASSKANHIASSNNSLLPLNNNTSIPQFRSASLLSGSYYVAKKYNVISNSQEDNTFDYAYTKHYENGLINLEGRGWMGFEKVKTLKDNSAILLEYQQTFPFTGKPSQLSLFEIDTASNNTNLVMQVAQKYNATNSVKAVEPSQSIQFVYREANRELYYQNGKFAHATGKTYAYDDFGNLIKTVYKNLIDIEDGSEINPDKNIYIYSQYDNDSVNWRLGYPLYHKITKSVTNENISDFNDEKDFALHAFNYDPINKNTTSQSQWDNVHNQFLTTDYEFDTFGNRTDVIQPSGATYTIDYEKIYHTYPSSWQSPKNDFGQQLEEQYSFDPRFGELAISIDYNNHPTIYSHDDFGRKTVEQVVAPSNAPLSSLSAPQLSSLLTPISTALIPDKVLTISTTSYEEQNNIPVQKTTVLSNWPNDSKAETIWSKKYLDGLGRVYKTSVQDPEHKSKTITDVQYDSRNQIVKAALPYFAKAPSQYVDISYDVLNRTTLVESPTDTGISKVTHTYTATKHGFDAVITQAATTDYAYQKAIQYGYFANELKMSKMQSANATTDYAYDLVGRMLKITAPKGQDGNRLTNECSYDALGRVVTKKTPSRGDFHFNYDKNDLLIEQRQANGSLFFLYDDLGRTLTQSYSNGQKIEYVYDDPESKNSLGHMTAALSYKNLTTLEASNHFQFDQYGTLASDSLFIGGDISQSFITQYQIDPLGRPLAIINPDSSQVTYEYNGINLFYVSQDKVSATYSDYTAMGVPKTTSYGNGVTTSYNFTVDGNIKSIKAENKEQLLFHKSYEWDKLNQLKGINDVITKDTTAYSYKDLRLTGEQGSNAFQYDAAGNIISNQGTTYQYTGDTWTSAQTKNGELYQAKYDAMGNMTQKVNGKDALTFTFDARNKLVAAQKAGDTEQATYIYDYKGTRVYKSTPNEGVELYINPIFSQKVTGDTTENLIMPKGIFGTFAQTNTVADQPTYLQTNHQGSTVLLTDSRGKTLGKIDYAPYGEVEGSDTRHINALYTGWEFDEYTGLYYMDYRYYDPKSGSFISADNVFGGTLTEQDALNDYAYVLNTPMVLVDRDGHKGKYYDYWYNQYQLQNNPFKNYSGGQIIYSEVAILNLNQHLLGCCRIPGVRYNIQGIGMVLAEMLYLVNRNHNNARAYALERENIDPNGPPKIFDFINKNNWKKDDKGGGGGFGGSGFGGSGFGGSGFGGSGFGGSSQWKNPHFINLNKYNPDGSLRGSKKYSSNISNQTSYNTMSTILPWSAINGVGHTTFGVGVRATGITRTAGTVRTHVNTTTGIAKDGAKAGEIGEVGSEAGESAGALDAFLDFFELAVLF